MNAKPSALGSQVNLGTTDSREQRSATLNRLPLTAVILTHNESRNIAPCVRALQRVDDLVIVDSGSTDDTVERACIERPDVRIFHRPFTDFGDQRNWAIEQTSPRYPWLLFVDADEYCDPELLDEIECFIGAPGEYVGGYVAGRNFFLGQWLKHSTMFPSYQLRLLKIGAVTYIKDGHGQREVTEGALRYLKNGWRHEGFSKGVQQWIDRHNKYSTEEANARATRPPQPIKLGGLIGHPRERRRALKAIGARLPGLPVWRFLYSYIAKGGFLDGRAGLMFCMLLAAHSIHIQAKVAELHATNPGRQDDH